ncbi:MAG: hypothetical protein JWO82_2178 [Akkermansiaceae bacterium]|nr:hypothetical protein [Akkermansiaceae bacterium]
MMRTGTVHRVATMQTGVRLRRARDGRGRPLPDARVGRFSGHRRGARRAGATAEAGDFLRMGLLLLGSAAGFGIAAAGTALTGNGPVAGAAGGFALLCAVLVFRNLGYWREWR